MALMVLRLLVVAADSDPSVRIARAGGSRVIFIDNDGFSRVMNEERMKIDVAIRGTVLDNCIEFPTR